MKITDFNIDKSNWVKVSFGEVVREVREVSKNPLSEGLERLIGLEHIEPENIHIKKWGFIKDGTTFNRKFSKGQVLFGRRRAYLKKAALADFGGICSGDITVMEAKEGLLPELLPFVVHNEKFFDYAVKNSAGSLSPRVKFKDLSNYEFLLPPKNQQAKIAELLWAVDEMIESLLIHKKNLLLFYDALIEKELLAFDGKKQKLSKFGKVIRGVTYKPEFLVDKYDDDKCIILRANNISDGYLNYDETNILSIEKVKKEQFLQAGDFAICMANGSKELVGKAALYEDINKNVSVGSFCSILRSDSKRCEDLLKHLFASKTYRFNIKRTISGSNINNLKPSDIENIEFRISENVEVLKTIGKLNSILTSINSVNGNIEDTRKLLKTFVNKIFI